MVNCIGKCEARVTYLCQTWTITNVQTQKLQSTICQLLRSMVKGGQQRLAPEGYTRKNGTTAEFSRYRFTNEEILKIAKMEPISEYILKQQTNWIGHCVRAEDSTFIKQLTFPDWPKTITKKSGIMPTTYRQVFLNFKKEGKTELQMITELKSKQTCAVQRAVTTIDSNGNSTEEPEETVENT